jgi:type II secretion system protein D
MTSRVSRFVCERIPMNNRHNTLAVTAILVMGLAAATVWAQQATTAPAADASTRPASAPATAPATAPAQATRPAPTTAPAVTTRPAEATPAATTQTAPATKEAAVARAEPDKAAEQPAAKQAQLRFQFEGVSYNDVVRRFAQMIDKPLVGDLNIDGTLTFFDSRPYPYDEGFDTLNMLLAMRGYQLVETGRFLRLVQLGDLSKMPIKIRRGEGPLDDVRPGEIVTVVLPLKHLPPEEASKAVVRMVSPFGSISPLGKAKGMVITDKRENIERIRTLIAQIDSGDISETQMKSVALKYASAKSVAETINNLFGRGPTRGRGPQAQPEEGIRAVADDRTNLVLLRGSGDDMTLAEQVAKQLDTDDVPGAAQMRIFALENARAEEMVKTVEATLPKTPAGRDNKNQIRYTTEARVTADASTNRLIVSAPIDQMPAIEKLIVELDKAVSDAGGTRVVQVKVGDAQQIAQVLNQALGQAGGARRGRNAAPAGTFRASAETRTNSIVLIGSAADIGQAASLIDELDRQPEGETREIHVVRLEAGRASDIARSLQRLFTEQRGRQSSSGLRVEAENGTNSLMISAPPADWPVVQSILAKLQDAVVETSIPSTRLIPVKNAKAPEIAQTLSQVYGRRRGPDVVPVVISANSRSNSLLVLASADDHATIAELVASMDVEEGQEVAPLQIIQLTSADAESLAAKLQDLLPQQWGEDAVRIRADKATNSVLLRAPASEREAIEKLVAQLDKATRTDARETRLLPLKHASAAQLAQTIGQLYGSTARRGRWQPQPTSDDSVTISAVPGDKTLLVSAPQSKMEEISNLAASMDVETGSAAIQVRTYQLDESQANEVASALNRLFRQQRGQRAEGEPEPRFEADRGTNQLMVSATAEQMAEIEQLIEKLAAGTRPASQTKTFELAHARAEEMVAVLENMLDAGRSRWGGRNRGQNQEPVRVAAMSGSNSIVVQGPPESLALAEELVATFDVEEATAGAAVQIVRLAKADCNTLARAVNEAIAKDNAGRRGRGQDETSVRATPEPNSNSLLLRGPAADLPRVIEMVRELDEESDTSDIAVRVFPLTNGEAAELARSLERLFRDITRARARGRGRNAQDAPFAISSDYRTNSLVVSTTPAHFALVEELLASLDAAPERSSRDMRYYWLKNADAWDVERQLNDMFSNRRGTDRPIISSDLYANAITVIAGEADMKEIEPIITKLDEAAKDNNIQVRVIPLANMRADKMADVLARVYGQMTESDVRVRHDEPADQAQPAATDEAPASDQPATAPAADGDSQPGEAVAVEASTQPAREAAANPAEAPPVTITIDKTSNSLIVSATRRDLDAIESLVWSLSSSASHNETETEVIPIKSADPAMVARVLNDLFNPRQNQPARRDNNNNRGRNNNNNQRPSQPQQPTVVQSTVTIVADSRTRKLIVRARPLEMEMIRAMVEQLDQEATVVSEVRVFTLRNTDAREVAANLKELFKLAASTHGSREPVAEPAEGADGDKKATGQESRAEMVRQMIELRRGVTGGRSDSEMAISVSANRQSNSVVVAAPADAMALIEDLVQELDQSAAATAVPLVKLYSLQHAQVSAVVSTLQQLFSDAPARRGARPNRGQAGAGEAPVIVTGDESAKLVVVSASSDRHELIAQVIDDIDKAQATEELTVKVYKLANADAGTLSRALQQTLSDGAGGRGRRQSASPLRIAEDRGSNSVVVRAAPDEHERIAALIAEMDTPAMAEQPVRLVPLNSADAPSVARMLNRVLGTNNRRGSSPSVVIEADATSRVLMVRADDDTYQRIRELAAELDAAPVSKASQELFVLGNAKAASVAGALRQAFAPQRGQRVEPDDLVVVVAEPGSNSVIVTANDDNMKRVRSLLERMDNEQTAGLRTELLLLRQARAEDIARVLGQVSPRGGRPEERVVVSAEEASNALVFSGPSAELDKLMKMALQLDQASDASAVGTHILTLENGDAAQTAAMIQDLYRQQVQLARQQRSKVEPLAVSADARANAVVLACSKEMFEQVSQWVNQVEQMKPQRGRVRLIQLENVDPGEVDKAIRQLFEMNAPASGGNRRRGYRGSPGSDRIETSILEQQKALLVTADDEDYETILQLVKTLDQAAEGKKKQVKVFTLEHADNVRIAQALSGMYRQAAGRNEADQVSISALPQTTTIVVTATAEKLEDVAHLIAQLDKPDIAPQVEFRVYPLENTTPTKILPALRQMLRQVQLARTDTQVDVQADERTRSIIVTAKAPVFEQIEKIIKTLDEAPAHEAAEVLIVPLKKAEAVQLAAVLNEMLRPSAANQVTPEARALQEQVRLLRVRSALDDKLPELDLNKPIKIQADEGRRGSNALVITSTPENLKAMQAVVEILDTVPLTQGGRVRVLALTNADAETVARTVREIFVQGKQLAGKAGSPMAGRSEPENTSGKALVDVLNVSADLRTNSVVVSGSEESVALAELLIHDLDREQGKFVTEVRAFRLKHANADRLAPLLAAVFAEGQAVAGMEGLRTQVTRLMTRDAKEGEKVSMPKPRSALTIRAEATTNILLVAARSDVMPLIADIIETMDVAGAGSLNSVRICTLDNADASRMRQVLSELYSGPNARLIRDEDRPTITVDTRTNALVISANDKTFAVIETLLKTLDAKQAIDTRDIRLVPLENAEAASLAAALQRLMDARVQRQSTLGARDAESLRVMIVADERSNSLIVGGSPESFEIVQTLAKQLDGASPALGGKVQILHLEHGNAGNLATTLANLFNQRYQAAATADVRRQRPIILPDLRTNSLLVAANNDDSKALASLLEQLDVELTDPAVQLVVLGLENNDSGVVGPMIERIFTARLASMTAAGQTPSPQDRVNVANDALSNALVVSASKENIELIKGLLAKIDVEPPTESGLIRIFGLEHADAPTLATMLQGLISRGLYKPGAATAGSSAALAARERVSIAADIRTNVLIVSASKENLAVIAEIINNIDRDVDPLLGDIRIYALEKAEASKLGPMLQQFFASKRQAEQAVNNTVRSVGVVVVADERTNTLLVAGGKENFAAVEAMIDKLDGESVVADNEFRVFYLRKATAATIQPMIQRLFDQRVARGEKDPVTILTDAKQNALIVGATPDDMKMVASLVSKLETGPEAPGVSTKLFSLVQADATKVADSLRSLLQSEGAQAGEGIGISVDERTNSVIVRGGSDDIERMGGLIVQLDRNELAKVTEIKVFNLTHADAGELAQILNDALNNKPASLGGENANRQSVLQFITRDEKGKELIASGLQEGVIITPDRRTNALVLAAPRANMPLLESLIAALDAARAPSAQIRVFPLANADARRMADVLRELFKLQAAGGDVRAVNYTLISGEPDAGASATVGSAEQAALTITVDVRTNSLLVGGTKQYVDLVKGVIEQLDSSPAQERITQIYRLRNAQARDIETALRTFLDQERQRLVATLGNDAMGNAQRLLEQEVAVVAVQSDAEEAVSNNTLLLSASPRYFKTLIEMVKELDQPPPQVLIQVLLAEVTLDNTTDLGVDWNYTNVKDGKTYGVGQNLGVQAAINQFGGFSVTVTGGDLSFFLRALQSEGRMEVLSRPQILASDNQPADINVGQRVPFVTNSRISDSGSVFNTIQYEDVGIILRVVPRINPDGFVRLEVNPEISSLSSSSVTISEGVSVPIINNRSATTTVTVQDGHTIVIGGLITSRDDDRVSKVPVLGDIPLLGNVFRKTTKIRERTELLIILTPYVLRCPEEADAATEDQIDRLNLLRNTDPEALKKTLYGPINGDQDVDPVREELSPGPGSTGKALEGATCPLPAEPGSQRPDPLPLDAMQNGRDEVRQ